MPLYPAAIPGPRGDIGPAGPPGASSNAIKYRFDAATTPSPSGGQLRNNNDDASLADRLYVSYLDSSNINMAPMLQHINTGDILTVQNATDNTKVVRYQATADAVDMASYAEISVTYLDGAAGIPKNNSNIILFHQIRGAKGDKGDPAPIVNDVQVFTREYGPAVTANDITLVGQGMRSTDLYSQTGVTATLTPPANRVLLMVTTLRAFGTTITGAIPSGLGLSWTLVTSNYVYMDDITYPTLLTSVYRAVTTGTAPTPGTLTITASQAASGGGPIHYQLFAINGLDVAAPIGRSGYGGGHAIGGAITTSASVPIGSPPTSSNSRSMAFCLHSGLNDYVPAANWTEINDVDLMAGTFRTATHVRFDAYDPTASVTFAGANTPSAGMITGVELKSALPPASLTWTKPANASSVHLFEIGGGGGGGGGCTSSTIGTYGGGGGGAGGTSQLVIPASQLAETETVIVGAGGKGGATGTNIGVIGTAGGYSDFAGIRADGGSPGNPGGLTGYISAVAPPGGKGGFGISSSGGNGGNGAVGMSTPGIADAQAGAVPGGGGGGGSRSGSTIYQASGAGGAGHGGATGGAAGTGAGPVTGAPGTAPTAKYPWLYGGGGAGGYRGAAGGNGARYGGGGGGGSSSTTTVTGADGADGVVIVITK